MQLHHESKKRSKVFKRSKIKFMWKWRFCAFFLIFQGNQIFWTKGSSIAFNQKWTRPLGFHRIHCSPGMIFHLLQKRSPSMCLHIRIDFHTLALKKKNIKKKIYSDSYPNWILKNLLLIFGQIRANPVFARKCAKISTRENLYE